MIIVTLTWKDGHQKVLSLEVPSIKGHKHNGTRPVLAHVYHSVDLPDSFLRALQMILHPLDSHGEDSIVLERVEVLSQ